jgi:hypothetical protein
MSQGHLLDVSEEDRQDLIRLGAAVCLLRWELGPDVLELIADQAAIVELGLPNSTGQRQRINMLIASSRVHHKA